MLRKMLYLSIAIQLFIGINILAYFDWGVTFDVAPLWQRLLPAVYILVPISLLKIMSLKKGQFLYVKKKQEFNLFLVLIALTLYLILFGQENFWGIIVNSFLLPVLFSFLMPADENSLCNYDVTAKLKNIILIFFIVECGLALCERLFSFNIFPYRGNGASLIISDYESGSFRSTALQNHPLQNALCTSIIMSFILISSIKQKYKYSLWLLGYIAILCFNTRGSIIGWGILFAIYIFSEIFYNNKSSIEKKALAIVFTIIFLAIIYSVMIYLDLGDRIVNLGIFDEGSAGERLRIWNIFRYFNVNYFLFGLPKNVMDSLTASVGVNIIENYWLIFIFRFGFIFTAILIYFFASLFKRLLTGYTTFQKFFVLICFLSISSTNNSLASPTSALALFIICCYAFNTSVLRPAVTR